LQYLNYFDYAIISLYFLILIGIGLYLKKRASENLQEYFLAGNKMPWWALGVTGMGWSLDAVGTMLITSLLFLLGPRGLFIEFRGGANLALIFMMIWTGKWHRRSNCMTGAEWMTYRFGDGAGGKFARAASAIAQIAFSLGMLAYMAKGVGLFFSMFVPISPFACSVITIGIAAIYTISSGWYGVVFSDIFQSVLITAGITFVVVKASFAIPDADSLHNLAVQITGVKEWATAVPQIHAAMPKAYEMYESLFMFTVFLVLKNIVAGFSSGGEPHYFAARNERECGKLTCLWACLLTMRWPMMMGFAILGLFLVKDLFADSESLVQAAELIKAHLGAVGKNQWPDALAGIINSPQKYSPDLISGLKEIIGPDWAGKLPLLSYEGTINAERILPAVLLSKIPSGMRGLMMITLIAAEMSTFSATMNKTTALFTRDIYQKFLRPKASHKELLAAIYIFSVSLIIVAFLFAYTSKSINDIWGWIMMGLGSGLAVPLVLRLYWWRFNGLGFALGMTAGLLGALVQRTFWPQLHESWQFVILTAIPAVFSIIGTYLSKPTDNAVLENFYRTTRPFGFWGPYKNILPPDAREATRIENRNDLIALPFGLCWIISMFMMPLTAMAMNFRALAAAFIVFIIGVAGLYKFWYKNLPPARSKETSSG
jgi:solute:Na+ symporter, SSS family